VPTTKITISGPLFSGEAARAAADFTSSLAGEIAEVGRDWIRLDTARMTRSGSDTGQAAAGVQLAGGNGSYTIRGGIREGRYAWPWLEGVSRRNASTHFSGYHSFRRTRLRLRKQIMPLADQRLSEFLARMGGTSA
jgi:hypothetical protein